MMGSSLKPISWGILLLGFLTSPAAHADNIESILDRLDRRIEDQEGQMLNFNENALIKKKPRKADRRVSFNAKSIRYQDPTDKALKQISNDILDIEKDIENLDTRVQLTRQRVLEKSKIDNFIEIEGTLKSSDEATIRSLTVLLDDYELYSLNEANELWLPSAHLPFYAGPMTPGSHTLKVEARLALRAKNGPPLNTNVYRVIKKSLRIEIPDGQFKKKFTVDLSPSEK